MLRFTGIRFAGEKTRKSTSFSCSNHLQTHTAQVMLGFYREMFLLMERDLFLANHGPKSNHSIQSLLRFLLIPDPEMFEKYFRKSISTNLLLIRGELSTRMRNIGLERTP